MGVNLLKRRTNDEIREIILNFLHDKRRKARSLKSMAVTPSELKRELKKLGLTENQIVTNLDFLIKNGWVEEQVRKYKLPKQKIEVEKHTYRLSNVGLRYFEKGSKFDTTGSFRGMTLENIKDSIIIIGTGNVVQKNYYELYSALDALKGKVMLSDLPENVKLDYIADIETFKAQLAKTYPEKTIIKKIWEKISALSQIGGFAGLVEKIYHLVKFFL